MQSLKILEETKIANESLKSDHSKIQLELAALISTKSVCTADASTSPMQNDNILQSKHTHLQNSIEQKLKEHNDANDNNLNEIKGLKSEILNLTGVLKVYL